MSSHVLVAAQLAALFAILAPAGKPLSPNIAGIMVLAFGTGLGVSTLLANRPGNFGVYPELRKGAHLIMIGPYHWIRHPHVHRGAHLCARPLAHACHVAEYDRVSRPCCGAMDKSRARRRDSHRRIRAIRTVSAADVSVYSLRVLRRGRG